MEEDINLDLSLPQFDVKIPVVVKAIYEQYNLEEIIGKGVEDGEGERDVAIDMDGIKLPESGGMENRVLMIPLLQRMIDEVDGQKEAQHSAGGAHGEVSDMKEEHGGGSSDGSKRKEIGRAGVAVEEVRRGEEGRAGRWRSVPGLVARVHNPLQEWRTEKLIMQELSILYRLGEAGLPVPPVISTNDRHLLFRWHGENTLEQENGKAAQKILQKDAVGHKVLHGHGVLFKWVEGEMYDQIDDTMTRQIAVFLAKMHTHCRALLDNASERKKENEGEDVCREGVLAMPTVEELLQEREQCLRPGKIFPLFRALVKPFRERGEEWEAHGEVLERAADLAERWMEGKGLKDFHHLPSSVIHHDLHRFNVLWKKKKQPTVPGKKEEAESKLGKEMEERLKHEGEKQERGGREDGRGEFELSCVIDFEDLYHGPMLIDFVYCLLEWGMDVANQRLDWSWLHLFYRTYSSLRPLTEEEKQCLYPVTLLTWTEAACFLLRPENWENKECISFMPELAGMLQEVMGAGEEGFSKAVLEEHLSAALLPAT